MSVLVLQSVYQQIEEERGDQLLPYLIKVFSKNRLLTQRRLLTNFAP